MTDTLKLDLGLFTEGTIDLDPTTGRVVLRVVGDDGKTSDIDVQKYLEQYKGEDVRFIVTPLQTVSRMAELVEQQDIKNKLR